ncbi:coatomer epsilon subunit [Strigomonas culicis]|nr:coatomer epsilon subunit [Strigomonas culicis]|eukprot:EPY35026.1 coatomer epsilon subunit [Strigomonas culicis]
MLQVAVGAKVEARNVYTAIFAAAALLEQGRVAESLTLAKKWLAGLPEPSPFSAYFHLELRTLVVEGLLRLGRTDLAAGEAEKMDQTDEESLFTILARGTVALAQGQQTGAAGHYDAALACFKDVSMRCGQTPLTLNLTALAHLGLGQLAEAQKCLTDALAVRADDPDTTANLAAIMAQLGKPPQEHKTYLLQATEMQGAWAAAYKDTTDRLDQAMAGFRAA